MVGRTARRFGVSVFVVLFAATLYAVAWPTSFVTHEYFGSAHAALIPVIAAVAGTGLVMAFHPAEVRIGWLVGVFAWTVLFLLVRWLVASRKELATSTESLRQESTRASEQSQLRVMAETGTTTPVGADQIEPMLTPARRRGRRLRVGRHWPP